MCDYIGTDKNCSNKKRMIETKFWVINNSKLISLHIFPSAYNQVVRYKLSQMWRGNSIKKN